MPWAKTPNVIPSKDADWSNFIHKEPDCSVEKAKRIAMCDPRVTFFFFCREGLVVGSPIYDKYEPFNPGDAVFFCGEPHYDEVSQCDSYQKNGMTIAYINNCIPENFLTTGSYLMADGSPAIDVVCIFAANLNINLPNGVVGLAHKMIIPQGYPILCANKTTVLQTLPVIKQLQDKGITVLLSVLGNHDAAGWSNFSDESTARNFAQQLQEVVDEYGLDGVDINDEYSSPDKRILESLVMLTSIMQELMPGKIISKALWRDLQYFASNWHGKTLSNTLTYGWEMSYGVAPEYRLPSYVNKGMVRNSLTLGFWSGQPSAAPKQDIQWLKNNGYGGIMVYAFETQANAQLIGELVNIWYGPGNWNHILQVINNNSEDMGV